MKMGEAKRRRDARLEAYATGQIFKPTPECPACRSRQVKQLPKSEMPPFIVQQFGCDLEACLDCRALWEAFPEQGYVEDPVCAEPCDNCAFRPGSPEQADTEGWKALIESLKPQPEGWFAGRFYCHKGVPIDMTKGPGNFLFPTKDITADVERVAGEPVGDKPHTIPDAAKMRTCSGFLRMFWARSKKIGEPAWMEVSDAQ
jgi:hypothetical protein